MKLTIRYYGITAEITGKKEELLDIAPAKAEEIRRELTGKYPPLKEIDFKLAQNNEFLPQGASVNEGEIALLPPFAGG